MSSVGAFEVRIKKPNGQIVSRHYENLRNQKQAKKRAEKAEVGRVLSVKKVNPDLLLGDAKVMGVDKLIGVHSERYNPQEGIVFENTTIDEIMFPHKAKRKERRQHRYKDKREILEE